MSSAACCMLYIVCCALHAVHLLSHVACCQRSKQFRRVRTRAERARTDALVGMAVADALVGRTPLVVCAFTLHRPQLPWHTLCTAAAPHPSPQSSVGLQLQHITAIGTEKALLAVLTEAHPEASYVELLRLFKVRRSVADWQSLHACSIFACCALPASI
jgi:hypothetical protein